MEFPLSSALNFGFASVKLDPWDNLWEDYFSSHA
jgi:hypothetical protein